MPISRSLWPKPRTFFALSMSAAPYTSDVSRKSTPMSIADRMVSMIFDGLAAPARRPDTDCNPTTSTTTTNPKKE